MVLQRNTNVKIWGWAAANENITITFKNVNYPVTANTNGDWELQLPVLSAGGPYVMRLEASNVIEISDILVGDVWICSGQSNMAMQVSATAAYYQNDINNATNNFIRNFNVPREYEFNEKYSFFV